jgi:ABC-type Fe3+/spermidine/putrescine transport system ATPase subunit
MIQLRDISKSYGTRTVLSNITLDVGEKSIVTLLGASGCGKTTTLRLIAGLEEPDRGEIFIAGRKVSTSGAMIPPKKRNIGMVFQDLALWPHMTVQENIEFSLAGKLKRRAERKQEVLDILDLVDLSALNGRYPAELSGGEQQRVALARALAARPSILLFDEPMANLDPLLKNDILDMLLDLHNRLGFVLLYVTHNIMEVIRLNGRIVLMKDGGIEQDGYLEDLRNKPQTEYVSRFVSNG